MTVLQKLRNAITGVEKSDRWYDRSHRMRVVLETGRNHYMESCVDARAYKLTEDELMVERDSQRLGEDPWKSYDRDRIVSAKVVCGDVIIERE